MNRFFSAGLVFALAAASVGAGAQSSVTDQQALDALKIQSEAAPTQQPYCDARFLAQQEGRLNNSMERADYLTASAQGEIMAGDSAACALRQKTSLAEAADRVGRLLAVSVIAATRIPGGMTTPRTASSGDRASMLLAYAIQHGSSTATGYRQALLKSSYHDFQ
jgi:hypothetical protein